MRIVSFVPGATAGLVALGLRGSLVGVTHECAGVTDLRSAGGTVPPALTECRLPAGGRGRGETIDAAVRTATLERTEIVSVDEKGLAAARPDLVVLPEAPSPCVANPRLIARICDGLTPAPRTLSHAPVNLSDVFGSIRALGEAAGRGQDAARLVADSRARVEAVRTLSSRGPRRRVALLSWVDPPRGAGGVLAELVSLAGGAPVAGEATERTRALAWEQVVGAEPEVIVLAPCGFDLPRARSEGRALRRAPELASTPAARWGQVHAVDGRAILSATGVGLVRGLEVLAALIHPELPWPDAMLPGPLSAPVPLD